MYSWFLNSLQIDNRHPYIHTYNSRNYNNLQNGPPSLTPPLLLPLLPHHRIVMPPTMGGWVGGCLSPCPLSVSISNCMYVYFLTLPPCKRLLKKSPTSCFSPADDALLVEAMLRRRRALSVSRASEPWWYRYKHITPYDHESFLFLGAYIHIIHKYSHVIYQFYFY